MTGFWVLWSLTEITPVSSTQPSRGRRATPELSGLLVRDFSPYSPVLAMSCESDAMSTQDGATGAAKRSSFCSFIVKFYILASILYKHTRHLFKDFSLFCYDCNPKRTRETNKRNSTVCETTLSCSYVTCIMQILWENWFLGIVEISSHHFHLNLYTLKWSHPLSDSGEERSARIYFKVSFMNRCVK